MRPIQEIQDVLFEVRSNLNVSLIEEGDCTAIGDLARNLFRDPCILCTMAYEYETMAGLRTLHRCFPSHSPAGGIGTDSDAVISFAVHDLSRCFAVSYYTDCLFQCVRTNSSVRPGDVARFVAVHPRCPRPATL